MTVIYVEFVAMKGAIKVGKTKGVPIIIY